MRRLRVHEVTTGLVFTARGYNFSDLWKAKGQHLLVVAVAKAEREVTFLNLESGKTTTRRYQPNENLCVLLRLVK